MELNIKSRIQHKGFDVLYIELPECVHGLITEQNGKNLILINSLLSNVQQEAALRHELAHLRSGHLDSARPVQDLEAEAREAE